MSQGESQVLQVLTTLQYLAEVGPKSPPLGHVTHNLQSIIRPLEQLDISFQPHTVLGYGASVQSITSIKMDMSSADISSLPLGMCSAGDLTQWSDRPKDYESAMGGMTLDSTNSIETGVWDVKDMEKEPEVEKEQSKVDKE